MLVDSALKELGGADIVHCDIKPANMLLGRCGTGDGSPGNTAEYQERLKLIDFGEANKSELATMIEVGTPGYMAPEVADCGECTSASDVYSAGVALVELWNGGIWAGADTRGEGSAGMRKELMKVGSHDHTFQFAALRVAYFVLISWLTWLSAASGAPGCCTSGTGHWARVAPNG